MDNFLEFYDNLFLSPILSNKVLVDTHYFALDWNWENLFLGTFRSSYLHFSSNGTSDSFQFILNSKKIWGITTKMVETQVSSLRTQSKAAGPANGIVFIAKDIV